MEKINSFEDTKSGPTAKIFIPLNDHNDVPSDWEH